MVGRNEGRPLGEDYVLQQPMNIYGFFIPRGTEFWKINEDYWQPLVNDALLPDYQVSFMIVRCNETYFKKITPK